jgi:predicted protein tyrosine phosphatase
MTSKILTCCKNGLVRSVGLADVLKLHFEPIDVIPIGLNSNSLITKEMLFNWADYIVIMEQRYIERVPPQWHIKVLVCEVGQDHYGNSHHPQLIDKCWRWARSNQFQLCIREHNRSI